MQRIFNVDKWTVIEPGQVLEFPMERPRLVRVEVNSPDAANLYLIDQAGEAFHLARVCGRDTVEFVSPGAFSLSAADGAISVYTVDGTSGHRTVEAPQSFTTIVERRRRNPELEAMMRMVNQNMEKRLAQTAEELRLQYVRREEEAARRRAAGAAVAAPASLPGDVGKEPASAGDVGDGQGSGASAKAGKGKRGGD